LTIYKDTAKPVEKRVLDLLSRMTLEEKVAQLRSVWGYNLMENREFFSLEKAKKLLSNGIGQISRPGGGTTLEPKDLVVFVNGVQRFLVENTRLGIPAILHEECLFGCQTRGATIFPQIIGVASTWEPEIVEEMSAAIRKELRALQIHQGLAPVLDVARDPRWGRMEETFGEDPYLVALMGSAYTLGLQSTDLKNGVIATAKHFAGYSASEGGLNWAPAHIPPREFREVFLFPFEVAVREAKILSIMSAYHEVDGIPCTSSWELLTNLLRKEWDFRGIVVSDYEAIKMLSEYHHLAQARTDAGKIAFEAGVDIELPETECFTDEFKEWLEKGIIRVKTLDDAVSRILRLKFELGIFENPYADVEKVSEAFDSPSNRRLAREIARKSIVLLKNEGNILPLNKNIKKIAVIGPNAHSWRNLLGDYCYPAVFEFRKFVHEKTSLESLSKLPNITVPVVTILEGIKSKVSQETVVLYAKGCSTFSGTKEGFEEAVETAKEADLAVMVVGGKSGYTPDCTSGEERDRADIKLHGYQERLIKTIYETGTPVALVLVDGRPLSFEWSDKHIPAIIEAWLPGEEGGNAVADVLFGDFNPGGKLPVTFPRKVGQIPVYCSHKPSASRSHLWEDYVDATTKCLYPFGHGLSYTEFQYSNLKIEPEKVKVSEKVSIHVDVENVGTKTGDEVVQLYLNDVVASVTRPVKELKGFKRITLEPGEKKNLLFELSTELLAFYGRDMKLVVEPGVFRVMVGSSSEDLRLQGEFLVVGNKE
jgi:beta-glucosidase